MAVVVLEEGRGLGTPIMDFLFAKAQGIYPLHVSQQQGSERCFVYSSGEIHYKWEWDHVINSRGVWYLCFSNVYIYKNMISQQKKSECGNKKVC